MLNILRNALIFTGIYFTIATIVFWIVFFVHVAVLIFWKPIVFVFALLMIVFTFNHYRGKANLDIFTEIKAHMNSKTTENHVADLKKSMSPDQMKTVLKDI